MISIHNLKRNYPCLLRRSSFGCEGRTPKASSGKAGFSVIELVVSLAVIVLVSAQVFVSFSGLGQGTSLNRAAQELVAEIRKAQYESLAVTYANVPVVGIPSFVIPPAVGIQLSTGTTPPQVIRFADRGNETCPPQCPTPDFPGPPDGRYTNASEKIATYTLPGNIKINKFTDLTGIAYGTTIAHILFQNPEATISLRDANGAILPGNGIIIELINAAGKIKTVTVQITGQINTR